MYISSKMERDREKYRQMYPKGTRVKLVYMDDVQAPPVGTLGTVREVDDAATVHINWDNGSSLGAVLDVDKIEIVKEN